MTTKEAADYYGGKRQLAEALGVWPQVIYQWGERPPMSRQYEIEVRTGGQLLADVEASHG